MDPSEPLPRRTRLDHTPPSWVKDGSVYFITICVRDYGKEVHPSQIKSRDLNDIRPGGLGVHIISECMDEVSYSPADGGGTVLTMRKKLAPESKGDRK